MNHDAHGGHAGDRRDNGGANRPSSPPVSPNESALEQEIRKFTAAYLSIHPNERQVIREEGCGGNHFRVMLGWVCNRYTAAHSLSEDDLKFIRPDIRKIVTALVAG